MWYNPTLPFDAADDFILVGSDKIKRVVTVVRIEAFVQNRFIVIIILTDSGRFGSWIEKTAQYQEFSESINIILQFCKPLVICKISENYLSLIAISAWLW